MIANSETFCMSPEQYKAAPSMFRTWAERAIKMSNRHHEESDVPTKHTPCYMYHVSCSLFTNSATLNPRVPNSSESSCNHVKRICVAPTIEQCLVALCEFYGDCWSIYRTKEKVSSSMIPRGVVDSPITQERWLMDKTKFVKVGQLNAFGYGGISVGDDEFSLGFGSRGGFYDFITQFNELKEIKHFIKRNERYILDSDEELAFHREQRRMRLKFNR